MRASSASNWRAVKKISLAKDGPTRSIEPLHARIGIAEAELRRRDRRISNCPSRCAGRSRPRAPARRRCNSRGSSRWSAWGTRRCLRSRARPLRCRSAVASSDARSLSNFEMSAPDTKDLPPAPVITTTRTSSSLAKSSRISAVRRPHVERHRVVPLGIVEDHVADAPSLRESILSVLVISFELLPILRHAPFVPGIHAASPLAAPHGLPGQVRQRRM